MYCIATPDTYYPAATEYWIRTAIVSIASRGRFDVALSGGSTPESLYSSLTQQSTLSNHWQKIHFWFGDERGVPPDDPQSNYGMVHRALLGHIDYGSVHRFESELGPQKAASRYTEELQRLESMDGWPIFDLVMLGMGCDGHVASLFPHSANWMETARPVSAAYIDPVGAWRVSLTLPVIARSRRVMVLVRGGDKATTLAEVLVHRNPDLPASTIANLPQSTWFLDAEASSLLPRSLVDQQSPILRSLVIPSTRR